MAHLEKGLKNLEIAKNLDCTRLINAMDGYSRLIMGFVVCLGFGFVQYL